MSRTTRDPWNAGGSRIQMEEQVLTRLDSGSTAARRGLSDLSIRNLFIIPTIIFLIVFNIFPLLYSLGYSFTDFRASVSQPATFVGLENYRDLLGDPYVWSNFTITAKYVLVSVGGQVLVGFGVALLLNRDVPGKGLVTTLFGPVTKSNPTWTGSIVPLPSKSFAISSAGWAESI